MYDKVAFLLAGLIAAAIIVIGFLYFAVPERILGGFGLRPPSPDADTRAWLRLKGSRDIVSGVVVLMLMTFADRRLAGLVLLLYVLVPLGDMVVVLGSGGSKSRALGVHGLTAAVMLAVGMWLSQAK